MLGLFAVETTVTRIILFGQLDEKSTATHAGTNGL
jgi:hypothetical protein